MRSTASGPVNLAQVNVARLREPAGSPRLREFMAALRHVNALAERAPGFVWRYPSGDGHLSGAGLLDDPQTLVNLSVWRCYEDLHAFAYRSRHAHYLRRRGEWFLPMPPPTTALWWVPADQRPTPAEAVARLAVVRRYGPTARAFTLRTRYDADGRPARSGARSRRAAGSGAVLPDDDEERRRWTGT